MKQQFMSTMSRFYSNPLFVIDRSIEASGDKM